MNKNLKELILAGILAGTGVILPMAFHMFGGAGAIFLPMHIPVLVGGFFLSAPIALALGLITPVLSAVLTGMPPVFPMMPIMMLELGFYGLTLSLVRAKITKNPYVCLLSSMIVGRIAAGFMVFLLATYFSAKLPPVQVFISGSIVKGLPGILIQLVIVPIVVFAVTKSKFKAVRTSNQE